MNGKLIAYWAATIVFAAFMAFDAYAFLSHDPKMTAALASLGYPAYFMSILGTAKLLGVVAILVPGAPRLKEWAYAGFTFTFLGAFFSHLASGQQKEAAMPLVALVIMAVSYLLRPPRRRILEAPSAVR
jgi:DoxX-like family